MNGSVLFEGNPILSGSLNVNTGGNIEPLEIEINENGTREITPPSGVDGYSPITIETNVPQIEPVLETLNVTQNGRYEPPSGVAGFDEVNVEVLPPLDTLTVTENGSYEPPTGVYGFSNVNVNVPTHTPTLETLNVTQNGTYTPSGGVDGYDEIVVNVPVPANALFIKNYEGVPTSIASFTDGTSNPLKSLTASIVPVQDLHGYDKPWAGGAGKNKFDVDLPHEEVSGSATYSYTVTVKANTDYTMSCNVPQDTPASLYFNGGNTGVNGVWNGMPRTFTSDENGKLTVLVRFNTFQGGVDLYTAVKNGTYYIQLEEGSSATTYAPYSNICPISGWTEEIVTRCGKNFFDKDHYKFAKGYLDGNGDWKGSTTIYDYPTEGLNYWSSVIIDVTKFGTDTITYSGFVSVSGTLRGIVDENFTKLAFLGDSSTASYTVDLSQYPTAKYIVLSFMRDNHDFSNAQLEIGSTATTYEPYAGTTYTIPFTDRQGQSVEVFGGSVDIVNGVVTPCPYYASYNGEQLTGKWISDRDVYSPNTSPTIGAQVVNIGTTDTSFYTQPTSIKSLDGVNNVVASTGDVEELKYFTRATS